METEANWAALAALERFAQQRGHSVGELAVAWLLSKPVVGSVIAGVSTPEQLAANVAAASWHLSAEDLVALDAIIGQVPAVETPPSTGGRPPRR
jgi:aryl-alcohol dehydrogenase-like predicted oxidoreductase